MKFINLLKADRKTKICFNVAEIGYVMEKGKGCVIFMIRDGRYGEINIDNGYKDVINMIMSTDESGNAVLYEKIKGAVEILSNSKKTKADAINALNA